MRKLFSIIAVLVMTSTVPSYNVAADDNGNIYVHGSYLTDDSGYNYGAHYYISSSVDDVTCVVPYVFSSSNVNGNVSSPFQLQPNEENVSIGEFISADRSQPWSVEIRAKWHLGGC